MDRTLADLAVYSVRKIDRLLCGCSNILVAYDLTTRATQVCAAGNIASGKRQKVHTNPVVPVTVPPVCVN